MQVNTVNRLGKTKRHPITGKIYKDKDWKKAYVQFREPQGDLVFPPVHMLPEAQEAEGKA